MDIIITFRKLLLINTVISLINISSLKFNYFENGKYFHLSHNSDILNVYYPYKLSLSIAVSNQMSSIDKNSNKYENYIYNGCTEYLQYNSFKNDILSLFDNKPTILYSSLNDNIVCYSIESNSTNIYKFLSNQLIPLPRLLKLDSSVAATLYHLSISHSKILTRGCDKSTNGLSCHPFLIDLSNNIYDALKLSIIFDSKSSKASIEKFPKLWYDKLISIDRSGLNELLLHLPKNYSNNLDVTLPNYDNKPRSTKNIDTKNLWDHINLLVNEQLNFENILSECQWSQLFQDVTYRHRSMIITLPISYSNEFNKFSSSCLTIMLLVITETSKVRKIGVSTALHLLNNVARGVTQTGHMKNEIYRDMGLTGKDIIVGIADTGIDENSCFFSDNINGKIPRSFSINSLYSNFTYRKVIQYMSYSDSIGDVQGGHGSHVTGIVAGSCIDGSSQQSYNGMAKDAKIAFYDIAEVDGTLIFPIHMSELYDASDKATARIQSNSWGGSYWYDTFCQETDEYLYNNDHMTIIYAAGNSGESGYQTVMSPSLSKNVIAVGATETGRYAQNIDYVGFFSSVGPAPDGRYKPDILAPGYVIYSANSESENKNKNSCKVTTKFGTSMSTPNIAGNAALIHQYFNDTNFWKKYCNPLYKYCQLGKFIPSGSLTKALILHSGQNVSKYNGNKPIGKVNLFQTPDIYQGYGRLQLNNILLYDYYNVSDFDLFFDIIKLYSFTELSYDVIIPSNRNDSSVPLKVTISWYDPPNEVFAAKVLLHDIDLVIVDPIGNTFYGNNKQRDEVNTNEQIIIYNPLHGHYNVRIQSKLLTESEDQKVSIVITSPSGVVTGSGISNKLSEVSPLDINSCQTNNELELDISLWSQVTHESWNESSYYSIYKDNYDVPIYSNRLIGERLYQLNTVCLLPGCYYIQLHLDGLTTTPGTILSIPECSNMYLTPLSTKHTFCISSPKNTTINLNDNISRNMLTFPHGSCMSTVQLSEYVSLSLYLAEFSGSGWSGAYYVFIEMDAAVSNYLNGISNNISNYTLNDSTVFSTAGALEWGFIDNKEVYLPAKSQCYYMLLSSPNYEDFYPYIYFSNNSDKVYDISNDLACPRQIQSNESLAMVCIDISTQTAIIHHYSYESTSSVDDFLNLFLNDYVVSLGQSDVTLQQVVDVFLSNELVHIDTCVIENLNVKSNDFVSGPLDLNQTTTDVPTVFPSFRTTIRSYRPTRPIPTRNPTFYPTGNPTIQPTTLIQSLRPTIRSYRPTRSIPTKTPSISPSFLLPTNSPTLIPSVLPTNSLIPNITSLIPTYRPTVRPTKKPTVKPTVKPTIRPVFKPTITPTMYSTSTPTALPSSRPTVIPTARPTTKPSSIPTALPIVNLELTCFETCQDDIYNFYYTYAYLESFFLAKVYNKCNSFSLVHGLCQIPSCANSCTIEDYCYYGIETLNHGNYDGLDDQLIGIFQTCVISYLNNGYGDKSDNGSYQSYNVTTLLTDDTVYHKTYRKWTISFYMIIGSIILTQIIFFWIMVEYTWFGTWKKTSFSWIIRSCAKNNRQSNRRLNSAIDDSVHDLSSSQHHMLNPMNEQIEFDDQVDVAKGNQEYEMVASQSTHSDG